MRPSPCVLGTPLSAGDRDRAQAAAPVLMMSGVAGSPGQFRAIATNLERDGFDDLYVVQPPKDGWGPLENDVTALAQAVDAVKQLTGSPKVTLLAHSKAGVAAVEVAHRDPKSVNEVVSVASPHSGAMSARMGNFLRRLPFTPNVIRDLTGGSPALANQVADVVPVTSIHNEHWDGMVTPRASTINGPLAQNITVDSSLGTTHTVILSNEEVFENVRKTLLD
jgi:pimeloyl-ACP methyl ester carboxylesterase